MLGGLRTTRTTFTTDALLLCIRPAIEPSTRNCLKRPLQSSSKFYRSSNSGVARLKNGFAARRLDATASRDLARSGDGGPLRDGLRRAAVGAARRAERRPGGDGGAGGLAAGAAG